MNNNNTWFTEIIETDDGTGDGLLQFSDEFILKMGWSEGTTLLLRVEEGPTGNVLYITEKK